MNPFLTPAQRRQRVDTWAREVERCACVCLGAIQLPLVREPEEPLKAYLERVHAQQDAALDEYAFACHELAKASAVVREACASITAHRGLTFTCEHDAGHAGRHAATSRSLTPGKETLLTWAGLGEPPLVTDQVLGGAATSTVVGVCR